LLDTLNLPISQPSIFQVLSLLDSTNKTIAHVPIDPVLPVPALLQPVLDSTSPGPSVLPISDTVYLYFINSKEHQLNTSARVIVTSPTGTFLEACPDTGSPISLISRQSLVHFPSTALYQSLYTVQLNGISDRPTTSTFVKIPVRFQTTKSGESVEFIAEAYIVEKLGIDMLLGNAFLRSHQLHIQWASHPEGMDYLRYYTSWIPITVLSKQRISRARIYVQEAVTILPGHGMNIKVDYRRLTPSVDGYYVRPQPIQDLPLNTFGSLVSGVLDGQPKPIPFANFGLTPIRLRIGQCIGMLEPCSPAPTRYDVYLGLAEIFEGISPVPEQPEGKHPDGWPYTVPHPAPHIDLDKAHISDYWGTDYQDKVRAIIKEHGTLFREQLGKFNDGIQMPVPFKEGVDVKDLKQVLYNLSPKDCKAMDDILDLLKKIGVVEDVPLGVPSPASSPAFVVWRDSKPRVVVDLRRVNTKLKLDAYPLLQQDDILQAMHGCHIFSSLDLTKSFFQQPLKPEDR
jgi:hypothetical protein